MDPWATLSRRISTVEEVARQHDDQNILYRLELVRDALRDCHAAHAAEILQWQHLCASLMEQQPKT